MGNSKSYFAPLGLAAIGALFGIGHFGGLHDTVFGNDNKTEITANTIIATQHLLGTEVRYHSYVITLIPMVISTKEPLLLQELLQGYGKVSITSTKVALTMLQHRKVDLTIALPIE